MGPQLPGQELEEEEGSKENRESGGNRQTES